MTETKDAAIMIKHVTKRESLQIWWAPGDHTRYLVYGVGDRDFAALVILLGGNDRREDTLVIMQPTLNWTYWSPRRWLEKGYPSGWWAGIRPLLAELGWLTDGQSTSRFYNPTDAITIAEMLNEQSS